MAITFIQTMRQSRETPQTSGPVNAPEHAIRRRRNVASSLPPSPPPPRRACHYFHVASMRTCFIKSAKNRGRAFRPRPFSERVRGGLEVGGITARLTYNAISNLMPFKKNYGRPTAKRRRSFLFAAIAKYHESPLWALT